MLIARHLICVDDELHEKLIRFPEMTPIDLEGDEYFHSLKIGDFIFLQSSDGKNTASTSHRLAQIASSRDSEGIVTTLWLKPVAVGTIPVTDGFWRKPIQGLVLTRGK